jgi:hypothetical protein
MSGGPLLRRAVVMVVSIAMLAVVAPWVPFNHAPDRPLARSQVDGTSRGITPALKVAVADPDRDPST